MSNCITVGKVIMYADDVTVLIAASTATEAENKIKIVIDQFADYCNKNQLIVNLDKTFSVQFRIRNPVQKTVTVKSQIQFSSSMKYLGVIIDENVKWVLQINSVCKKLNYYYYQLRHLKTVYDQRMLLIFYDAFIVNTMKYAIIIWGASIDRNRVFKIQKKILRLIFKLKYTESCRSLFKDNMILTYYGIFGYELITEMYKLNYFVAKDSNHYYTRPNSNVAIRRKTAFYEKFPTYYIGYKIHARLPEAVKKENNLRDFQTKLKTHLIKIVPYDLCDLM